MSVKTYTDTTRIIKTIEEHVWEIHCDAIGCNASLEFRENRDTGDITADDEATSTAPHTTKTNKTPTTKKETTPALAGIGKGEPMTALLDGRLRDLATQTHLLEKKVDALGWMAANGPQTLKSMTRAQAHLMLAEYDLLDALEAGKKEENR